MVNCISRVFFLLALASSPIFARAGQSPPDVADAGDMLVRSNCFWEFSNRLERAVERRDFAAIQELYQTNGMASEELKLELSRWMQLLDRHVGERVAPYFKDLDLLPSQARESWTSTARRLTDRKVTHVVSLFFPPSNWAELVLPLVVDQDKLLIVVSEKRNAVSGGELGPLMKWRRVTRSETNSTSSATGSRLLPVR